MHDETNYHLLGRGRLIHFIPIATVRNHVRTTDWIGARPLHIVLRDDLKEGLTGLADFSHVIVVTYLHEAKFIPEKHLIRRPRGLADMPLMGIFAQRAKDRPNPIGITEVRVVSVADGVLTVEGLDAIDGTPVLDVKPHYPAYDKRNASVPEWVTG